MKRLLMLPLLVVLSVLSAGAQNRGEVVRADYGAGNNWADVTQRVRSLARGNDLVFRVDNNTLGVDPRQGSRKTLRLQVREQNGRTRQLTFRENQNVTLRGYGGFAGFQITHGTYGAGNRTMDVTRRLNSQMRGGLINMPVSNQTMGGDPAQGQRKALTVWFTNDGRAGQTTIYEGDTLNLGGNGNYDNRYVQGGDNGNYDNRNQGGNNGNYDNRYPQNGNGNYNQRGLLVTRAEYGVNGRMMDVTNRLNSQIQGGGQFNMQVSNETMGGDPAQGQRKTLTVWFTDDGRPAQTTVYEGDNLNLPGAQDQQQRPFGGYQRQ